MPQSKLFEGLRKGDLVNCVEHTFTVDQFTSKMGNDRDVAVLRFRVKDKFPAIDMMEFIEKGYPYVLDADISSGEEKDGNYSVFVELERTKQLPQQISGIIEGLSALTDINDWRFRFYKDITSQDFSVDAITESIPLTPEDYETNLNEQRGTEVSEFFDQGTADVEVSENLDIKFTKVFGESLTLKLVALGEYEKVKDSIKGAVRVDEASASQTLFLEKYLGNYEIHKIGEQFLIRNGKKAVVVEFNKG